MLAVLVIVRIIIFIMGIWMLLSWVNSQFNDEDKDVTDASSPDEYIVRKIFRFFNKK